MPDNCPPSENYAQTVANTPLPQRGYTLDQLTGYILRSLGYPTWTVELTPLQIQDCIQDAMTLHSKWRPIFRYESLRLTKNIFTYLEGVDVGQGIAKVEFVEPNPVPTELFYGNLIDPAPLFRTGLDEYDAFLRWRKVWQRITSVRPDWLYDDYERVLYIHNPIERYHASVYTLHGIEDPMRLDLTGSDWVKRYALEKARYLHGEIIGKFSGAIPGPIKDIQMDGSKRERAEVRLLALEEELKQSQTSVPISID